MASQNIRSQTPVSPDAFAILDANVTKPAHTYSFAGAIDAGEEPASKAMSRFGPVKSASFPFLAPKTGHVCDRCRQIPAEIFLLGSSFFSHRCKARHVESNCKGKHHIACYKCLEAIETTHYHCGICNDDNLDICGSCHAEGVRCTRQEHELGKRIFDKGIVREVSHDDDSYHHPGLTQSMVGLGFEPYRLHDELNDLFASADAGCHFCSVLVTQIPGLLKDVSDSDRSMPVYIENRPIHIPMNERWIIHMSKAILEEPDIDDEEMDESTGVTVLAVRAERDPENPVFYDDEKDRIVAHLPFILRGSSRTYYSKYLYWNSTTERRQVAPAANAGDNLKVVGTWLQQCFTASSTCSAWPADPFKPTRLIHLANFTGEPGSSRLVRGEDITDPFPGYVTLSYCWGASGQDSPWTLTKAKLSQFEAAIPDNVLPKTIADAVEVVRTNKIQYLWVDSICIVQDDAEDWRKEAFRMRQVYNGSLFTIVSGGDSATSGLFLPRQELKFTAAEARIARRPTLNPEPDELTVSLYPQLETTGYYHGPTSKRGWCYQEEILSARRLYFTHDSFHWECICSYHSEAGVRSPGDMPSDRPHQRFEADVLLRCNHVESEWSAIVEDYTSRQLTYHSDVFAALAGIASLLKPRYNSRYFAGMWEDKILDGILWQRVGSSLARPTEFSAPSWSWLSVKGPVVFGRGYKRSMEADADYIGSSVGTIDGDEFGTVSPGGSLHLRARLLHCEVARDKEGCEWEKLENTYQEIPSENTRLGSSKDSPSDSDGSSECATDTRSEAGQDAEEHSDVDSNSSTDGVPAMFLRQQPWEVAPPTLITPPGDRLDLAARVKLCTHSEKSGDHDGNSREFATVFFDHEDEALLTEFAVAFIGRSKRPGNVMERHGIAVVPVPVEKLSDDSHAKFTAFRRVGFVAFWDKLLKEGDQFWMQPEKEDVVLV